jgi:hypothetical protein
LSHTSLEGFAGGDDDVAGNVPIPLRVVLAGDGLVELRLNDVLDGTALLKDAIKICAQLDFIHSLDKKRKAE